MAAGCDYRWILSRWFTHSGQLSEQQLINAPAPASISRYIGILERLLIYDFVWQGAYEATSFIITGKALLRLREANQERHSEYILVGTLLSATCAVLTSLALSELAGWLSSR